MLVTNPQIHGPLRAADVGVDILTQCPKEDGIPLQDDQLVPGLSVQTCQSCGGVWIPPEHYVAWQQQHIDPDAPTQVSILPMTAEVTFSPPALDNRAALCPDCRSYLVRGRITLQDSAFFVERCPLCKGIWCDAGEWEVLQQLGLDSRVDYIFSNEWQAQVRELEHGARERRATIDKLGPDLAERVFELAELLENHPNGDFGVAYLMRRFGD
jgi:Zn-finger nucleic acid-binding protein